MHGSLEEKGRREGIDAIQRLSEEEAPGKEGADAGKDDEEEAAGS